MVLLHLPLAFDSRLSIEVLRVTKSLDVVATEYTPSAVFSSVNIMVNARRLLGQRGKGELGSRTLPAQTVSLIVPWNCRSSFLVMSMFGSPPDAH